MIIATTAPDEGFDRLSSDSGRVPWRKRADGPGRQPTGHKGVGERHLLSGALLFALADSE